MKTANNEAMKSKYITRTITWWTGKELKADYATLSFKEYDMTWFDELDIPRERVKDLQKHEKLLRMKLSDFIRMAEEIEK